LKQILLNLLSNAIKYNRTQGSIVVDCAETALGQVRLSVLDTGLGLDANQLLQLFQPFGRLGQESGHQEGTGIGLVVTKRLVEMMEGTIRVTSTVDVGSNFSIELPAAEPGMHSFTGEAVMPATPAEPPSVRRLLLYIEDNPANLKLIEEIVRFRRDLDVLSAPDGHLGVQLARVHTPDVILMDIHLPGISGIDAFQILRHDPRTAHIPVVALTASAMPREISKGLAAGFFRYITKPIDIAEVTEAIDSALVRARPARRWSRSPTGP
jgi:CheY-like chemotaxis protein